MKKRITGLFPVAAVLTMAASVDAVAAHPELSKDLAERCGGLINIDLSGIPDAPTELTETKLVERSASEPEHCEVSGYVAPQVGFLVRLPVKTWNGKFIQLGCGGFCGTTRGIAASTGDFSGCADSVRRGYACAVSDNGHTGAGGLWAYNNLQAEIDHAYRGAHVTALAGKAIIDRYYGRRPQKSYFWGCSTGGRQGLMEAQRFPWDFDGVIAGSPSINVPSVHMSILWNNRALVDENGELVLGESQIDVLHRAVLAKCDMDDGIRDGLIGDPLACDFDPMELLCTAGTKSSCLTAKQVAAAKKIYSGPITSGGEQIYLPGAMRGSEKTWLKFFTTKGILRFIAEEFRYSAFFPSAGPTWRPEDFDFDRDYRRLGVIEPLYSAVNPDLRRFKAAGGKLLAYVGWNDAIGMPLPSVDFYETVERTMGGRAATQEFFRLFAIPAMDHCSGGDGAFAVDWLGILEAWVEKNQPPDKIVGAHVRLMEPSNPFEAALLRFPLDPSKVEFTRPLFPYPLRATYRGTGNPVDESSFGPAEQ